MQLIEDWGSALFKIEKKSTPHFGVQTPYLAAVVKGTTFTVTVGPEDAKVKVTEGAVEVSTLDGGATDLVRPGSLAMVGRSDLYRLTVEGIGAKELRSTAAPLAGVVTVKTPNEASVAKGDNRSARAESVRIAKAIGEKPMSLAKLTGGLVEGASASEHAQGQFNEHSRNARGPKPDKGSPGKGEEKPAENGKPDDGTKAGDGNGDPGKGEDKPADPGKGEDKPADPGNGEDKPADPGKGEDKPADPGKGEDKPADPGKGEDKPADPGKGEDKPADPGKGEDKPADPGKGEDKPADPGKGEDKPADPGKGEDKPGGSDQEAGGKDDDAGKDQPGTDDGEEADDGGEDKDDAGDDDRNDGDAEDDDDDASGDDDDAGDDDDGDDDGEDGEDD
jgi:hypothetical protein